jgi:hypothetical protein
MHFASKFYLNNFSNTVLSLLLVACSASADEKALLLRLHQTSVPQYELLTVSIPVSQPPANPFDPDEVKLEAVVKLPSGKQYRVPGFWYQEYRRYLQNPAAQGVERIEQLEKVGNPEWRVHLSSGEVGLHRIAVELTRVSAMERSADQAFTVTASATPGFVRRSNRNPKYLEHESGEPFFPIGLNLCMYQKEEGTYYYDRLLARLVEGGGDYARIWQEYYVPQDVNAQAGPGKGSFTGFPLETVVTGLGRYDLESAWRLDYLADLCERLNVHWQLTFEMTVWWQRRMAYRWKRNPYNAQNGGPCVQPSDYFTNARARELVRRRLRYSVARWGWTTKLAAWELWNEVDNNEGFDSNACAAWHREMGDYLKSLDPWKHLVTTSWRDRQTFALPQIDIVQAHSYWGPEYDAAQYTLQDTDHLMRPFGKPFFFGEQGIEGPVSVDPDGKHFHDALWASSLSGAAGAGLYWWWHNYVEVYGLYRHYGAFKRFVAGVDWPAFAWRPIRLSRPSLPVSLNLYGLVAENRALVWIHDPLASRIVGGREIRGPQQEDASANFVGLADGTYEIEWWDSNTGSILKRDEAAVHHLNHFGYGLELKPPPFWGDIAAKIIRKGSEWRVNKTRDRKKPVK